MSDLEVKKNESTSGDWTWKKATTLKLSFWPDAFILAVVVMVSSVVMNSFEALTGFEGWGGVILYPTLLVVGRFWLSNIERRNPRFDAPEFPSNENIDDE